MHTLSKSTCATRPARIARPRDRRGPVLLCLMLGTALLWGPAAVWAQQAAIWAQQAAVWAQQAGAGEDNVTVQLLRLTDAPVTPKGSGRTTRELPEFNDDKASPVGRGRRHHVHVVIAAVVLLLGLLFWTQQQPIHTPEVADQERQPPTDQAEPESPAAPDRPSGKSEAEAHSSDDEKSLELPEDQPPRTTQTTETAAESSGEEDVPADSAPEMADDTSPETEGAKGETVNESDNAQSAPATDSTD